MASVVVGASQRAEGGRGRPGKGPGIFTNAVKVLNDEKRGVQEG